MVTDPYGLNVVEPNVVNFDEMINLRCGHGIDTIQHIFEGGQILFHSILHVCLIPGDTPFTTWRIIFPLTTLTGCVSMQADGWLPD
jgi:hypothetical protein